MPKFRKKPVEIEAVQFNQLGDHPAVKEDATSPTGFLSKKHAPVVTSPEEMRARLLSPEEDTSEVERPKRRSSFATGKGGRFKKTLSGQIVDRKTGEKLNGYSRTRR